MLLIVGLGNAGLEYQNNRHNVGFQFIDFVATLLHCYIAEKNKYYLTMKQLNNEKMIFAKPQTFMNLSGQAVKKMISNFNPPAGGQISNLIVTHDDLDIPLGKFKIQKGTGPKLHNGIESVEKVLKTKDFWRVRIGVDNRQQTGWVDGETYVLQNFRPEEKNTITKAFPSIFQQLKSLLKSEFNFSF
ncbi:aminoacyl-tRNA hydrolase [Candidatus Roizmanbacteria bacterium CG_4_10_14_0_8_um_filter_36_36]|nr:MAG: aminoacyl-tRNA hydrolase [Candidatus Roizmanbacteria bacterium CG_4_10_14_0_8_um_filter_36_36]